MKMSKEMKKFFSLLLLLIALSIVTDLVSAPYRGYLLLLIVGGTLALAYIFE